MLLWIKIGFLPVRLWDVLDILIVGYLMYQLYKLLRGSIAFNILIGLFTLYMFWFLVGELQMDLLQAFLGQFVNVGVIILIIIFQPEVRRFLLFLGNTTLKQRSNFLSRILDRNIDENTQIKKDRIKAIKAALLRMSRRKVGALIVFARNLNLAGLINAGVVLDAEISDSLLESIFNKESPLHDGAVIIDRGKIKKASCILPVSESVHVPKNVGLRHRAAMGVTERANVVAFVVSEETGYISFASKGFLRRKLKEDELVELLTNYYIE